MNHTSSVSPKLRPLKRGSHSVTRSARSRWRYGQRVPGLVVDGKELQAGVFNENEVRAAAGLTMVIGAVAFCYAYFTHNYIPLQAVASFFFAEFLIRVTAGVQYSPTGLMARAITRQNPPQWVSAKPKRFAWTLGLGMGLAMTIITNSGIRGYLPRTICLICLALMWMETALGLCLGCEIHGLLVRRGWVAKDPGFEVCANGACDVPQPASQAGNPGGGPARLAGSRSAGSILASLDSVAPSRPAGGASPEPETVWEAEPR